VSEYLKRLEVGAEGRLNCFIYAPRMAGVETDMCDKVNARCYGRYLQIKHVKVLCEEFGLNVEVKRWRDSQHSDVVIKANGSKQKLIRS
jgi:hypothetical protein